jgi:hypothetical protein
MPDPAVAPATFISLLPSTDAEFVRWILFHYGVTYVEQPHPPLFQPFAARRAIGRAMTFRRSFTSDSNAVVLTGDATLWPRDRIADYFEGRCVLDRKLVPPGDEPKVADWWKEYAYGWGWSVARWCYYGMLPDKSLMMPSLAGSTVPATERRVVSLAYPLVAFFLRRDLKLSAQLAVQDLAAIHGWFDKIDALLAGQPFLTGARFTLADLLFVSYGAPIVFPAGYGAPLPSVEQLPADMRGVVESLRKRPTGQFLLRMYELKTSGQPAGSVGL